MVIIIDRTAEAQLPGGLGQTVTGAIDNTVTSRVDRTVDEALERPVRDRKREAALGVADGKLRRAAAAAAKAAGTLATSLDPLGRLGLNASLRTVTVENGWRAIENEWIAILPPAQMQALQDAGIHILSHTNLTSSGLVLVRVRVSDADDNAAMAERLLREFGATAADRNHVYAPLKGPSPLVSPEAPDREATGSQAGEKTRIGLIDTAIDLKHAAFKSANIISSDFVDGDEARPLAHGTAIASLLIGVERQRTGVIAGGQLVAASAFYRGKSGITGATTSSLVASLDWLAGQGVTVTNMSLAGPPNEVLRVMLDTVTARGMIVVAAVGNDGPTAKPLYPAAYPNVVAVTAIDQNNRVYRWANRGPQVDFAAWGVQVDVAKPGRGYQRESGTSFAAPLVSAEIARLAATGGGAIRRDVLAALIAEAEDLGPPGRDDTYGYGLLKPASVRPAYQ